MTAKTDRMKFALSCALVIGSLLVAFRAGHSIANTKEVSATDRLLAIEEIHQLKARYLRCMDLKDWDCWEGVFAPTFVFKAGDTQWHGPKEMLQSTHISGLFDRVKTAHYAHMPEIEILSPTTARGIWSVDFLHYFPTDGGPAQGNEAVPRGQWNHTYGFYYDTYVKIKGRWFIQSEEIRELREDMGGITIP